MVTSGHYGDDRVGLSARSGHRVRSETQGEKAECALRKAIDEASIRDAEINELYKTIISSQQSEIDQMKTILYRLNNE